MSIANLENDKWFLDKVIDGWFEVTDTGLIKKIKDGKTNWRIHNGYMVVSGYDRLLKKSKQMFAHRLVWIVFKGLIIDPILQINHIDGNKLNNHLNNLELVTPKENSIHAYRTGLHLITDKMKQNNKLIATGENNGMAKFTNAQVIQLRQDFKNGKYNSQSQAAKEYNVSQTAIGKIINGVRFKHLPL